MKHEWRKQEKEYYLPKPTPTILDVPQVTYLRISGSGRPAGEEFSQCVGALYNMAYGIKMAPKKNIVIDGYFDYTVYPLEGVWDLDEEGKALYTQGHSLPELKDHFLFTVMIRQPDFVTPELVEYIRDMKRPKNDNPKLEDVELVVVQEGTVCQMLHLGSYDDEPASFAQMEAYCEEQGYRRSYRHHQEIYLNDPKRVAPDKLKTVLRFQIEPNA